MSKTHKITRLKKRIAELEGRLNNPSLLKVYKTDAPVTNSGDDVKVEIIASGINGGTWYNEYHFGPIRPEVIHLALNAAMQNFADDIKYIVEHGAEEYEKMIASRD